MLQPRVPAAILGVPPAGAATARSPQQTASRLQQETPRRAQLQQQAARREKVEGRTPAPRATSEQSAGGGLA